MLELKGRKIDQHGQVFFTEKGLIHLLMTDQSIEGLIAEPSDAIKQLNSSYMQWDSTNSIIKLYEPLQGSHEAYHGNRTCVWFIPENYQELDVKDWLLMKCHTLEQVERVMMEWELFEQRQLTPVLRFLIYLVDYMREHGILWGIGRGSSVASYCLFLIGTHRIDSIKYDLDITEFLK